MTLGLAVHGASRLTTVEVDTYNAELRDADGFVGDRASNRAFRSILDDWRERLRRLDENHEDPVGEESSSEISKKKLDKVLVDGDTDAAGLVLSTIEDFAQELATVIRRFLKLKGWKDTEEIVVGGGLRNSRIGELAIGRAAVLVKAAGNKVGIRPIRYHPDEAGLLGCVHLAPPWIFSGHDSILAADIGGTNIRAGIVQLNLKKAANLSKMEVYASEVWRHADDKPKRDEAVERLAEMLRKFIARAEKDSLKLAPFVGIGCPGLIKEDGSILKGGQNLPGNWQASGFRLPEALQELIPTIGEHQTVVVLHNDAVVQGLSEVPFMRDSERWGIVTIGTGLGNARFTNRADTRKEKER